MNPNTVNLTEYHLHIHTQICTSCEKVHKWSELYAVDGIDKVRDMRRIRYLPISVPVQAISIPVESVPLCHSCVKVDAITDLESVRRWDETLRRKREEAQRASAPRPSPSPQRAATLDEIL